MSSPLLFATNSPAQAVTSEAPITIDVPGLPIPYARSGARGAVRFTPPKQRHAMADIKVFASLAMAGRKPLEGPLAVVFDFTWPMPASWSKRRRNAPESRWRASRPDIDNLTKLVADSLNGIVWLDDALIVEASGSKRYADSARTLITVRHLVAAPWDEPTNAD